MGNITNWKPIRKIRGIIWAAVAAGLGAMLDKLASVDWQTDLVEEIGPRWTPLVVLALAAALGYARRSAPDEVTYTPGPVDVPEDDLPADTDEVA